jgi:hypothetical protein
MKYLRTVWLLAMNAAYALPVENTRQDHEGVGEGAAITQPASSQVYSEIEPALIDKYFAKKPSQYLVDPQALITGQQRKTIEKLLSNHAADSTIDLYLFVFGGDQQLPADGKNRDFMARHFANGKPAVVLYYYLGMPAWTGLDLSPGMSKSVSASEQERSLQGSLVRAMRENGSFEQLAEYLMQFSVRTYWMERMMDEASAKPVDQTSEMEPPDLQNVEKEEDLLELIPDQFREPALMAAGGLGSLAVLSALVLWLRSRARLKFPESEIEARLGGPHAAGIGAVVNFASPDVSPALQRKQIPEYLRRV